MTGMELFKIFIIKVMTPVNSFLSPSTSTSLPPWYWAFSPYYWAYFCKYIISDNNNISILIWPWSKRALGALIGSNPLLFSFLIRIRNGRRKRSTNLFYACDDVWCNIKAQCKRFMVYGIFWFTYGFLKAYFIDYIKNVTENVLIFSEISDIARKIS